MGNLKQFFFLLPIIVLACSCARRGRPEGGPKDEKAPIMVIANPPHKSLKFNKNAVKIFFDEYIVLKNLNKQLLVSPPLKTPLAISPQGTPSKYINIKILDTLKANTTYTFNFGNAIQDNNEGNKLESFKYVFSTGQHLDSLYFKGKVAHAFKKEADKDINVLLFKYDSTFNDSVIYKKKPHYVSNTLDSTAFNFSNLKDGNYLLLALKESSNDYLFNPKTDEIGFLSDTLVLPRDSVLQKELRLFKEKQKFVLKRPKELFKGKIQFGFNGGDKKLKVQLLSSVPKDFSSFTEFEKNKDTLLFWHTPIASLDSLQFLVTDNDFIDTVTVRLKKKRIDSLKLSNSISNVLNLKDTLFLEANNPIVFIDSTKIKLLDKDSIEIIPKLKKISNNKLAILFEKNSNQKYILNILPDAISDIFNTKNDSLDYQFNTKDIEDYGAIVLNIQNKANKPLIVELLEKSRLIARQFISTSKKLTFELLEPKEYLVRVIVDENNNKTWDTGNFLNKKQPERVLYFPEVFKLRANWIQNEVFLIE
ncbi:MAG: Ig-like domain-containing protein [Tenacibaculum sp.]